VIDSAPTSKLACQERSLWVADHCSLQRCVLGKQAKAINVMLESGSHGPSPGVFLTQCVGMSLKYNLPLQANDTVIPLV
jgi:hypothetical protein